MEARLQCHGRGPLARVHALLDHEILAAFQRPALARSRLRHGSTRSSSIAAILLRLGGSGQQPVSTTGGAVSKSLVLHCRTDLMPLVSAPWCHHWRRAARRAAERAAHCAASATGVVPPQGRAASACSLLEPGCALDHRQRISSLPYRDWPLRPDEVDRQTIPAQHFAVICSVPLSG